MMENMFKLHRDMPRQGPGNNEATKKALALTNLYNTGVNVLDIGCGPGMQTIELAKSINGEISALDFHRSYLEELEVSAKGEKLSGNIRTIQGSMFELEKHFEPSTFGLIWSEGAIYIMGFENGIKSVKPLLKDNGYVVVSEITWLKENPPKELKGFWDEGYPKMTDIEGNKETIINSGYELIDAFVLPEEAWWDNYYVPLKARCERLRLEEPENEELMGLIDETLQEIDLFKRYSDYYGYVFYVMKK